MSSIAIQQSSLSESSGNKTGKWLKWFIGTAGCIFMVTGLAKTISAFGAMRILDFDDPIFGISFRHLMLSVGAVELIISGICLFSKKQKLSLGLVAWMSTCFMAYRVGLSYAGWQHPCSCMGNLSDVLHLAPQTADLIMKIILAYLFIGSYCLIGLFWSRFTKK
jgi:hypothetical protein